MDKLQNVWRFLLAVVVPFGHTMTSAPSAPWAFAQIVIPVFLAAGSQGAKWWGENVAMLSLYALGAYFVVAIFLAWEREYNSKRTLEERALPKIKVTPFNYRHPAGWRIVGIEIENISESAITGCFVREEHFENKFGNTSGQQRFFQLVDDREADMKAHTYSKTFNLQGKGLRQLIDIAYLNELEPSAPIVMLFATAPTSRTANAISKDAFPHKLLVSIASNNLPIVEKRWYIVAMNDNNELELKESITEPSIRLPESEFFAASK
jgi:hypothetical protein